MQRTVEYIREDGSNPYRDCSTGLILRQPAKVAIAVTRLSLGNTSNLKRIGDFRISDRLGTGLSHLFGRRRECMDIAGWRNETETKLGCGTNDNALFGIQEAQIRAPIVETQEVNRMGLTRDFKETIVERVKRDPDFAKALLDEAATLFLNGEPQVARLILRDLVNATIGFEGSALKIARPAKSLHRMLSKKGNPSMDNLAAILGALREELGVELEAHTVKAA
jgi:DNA-binding phage protein